MLHRLNPETGQILSFEHGPSAKIVDLIEDESGNIWLATLGEGLFQWNREQKQFYHYRIPVDDSADFSYDYLYSLKLNEHGQIWIGGGLSNHLVELPYSSKRSPAFLAKFHIDTKHFETYIHPDPRSMVHSIFLNSNNTIIGATAFGTFQFNPDVGEYFEIKSLDQLELRGIRRMARDSDGDYWIAGLNTLHLFTTDFQKVMSFSPAHGFHPVFFLLDLFPGKSKKGNFFVSAKNEFYQISPSKIKDQLKRSQSKVILSDFTVNNQEVHVGKKNKQINLRYDQNVFAFRFGCVDFRSPSLNMYLYKLENYDQQWRKAAKEPSAQYAQVSARKLFLSS